MNLLKECDCFLWNCVVFIPGYKISNTPLSSCRSQSAFEGLWGSWPHVSWPLHWDPPPLTPAICTLPSGPGQQTFLLGLLTAPSPDPSQNSLILCLQPRASPPGSGRVMGLKKTYADPWQDLCGRSHPSWQVLGEGQCVMRTVETC